MSRTTSKSRELLSPVATAQVYTSSSTVRITGATLSHDSQQQPSSTNELTCNDTPLITRRGCPIVLEVSFSLPLALSYTVTVSFIPVHGPRERSCTFRAAGHGKSLPKIWLSIELPSNFPIGHYDVQISMSQHGCPEILSHTLHSELVVLFNPWLPDDEVYMEKGRNEYLLSDIGVIWRGTQNKPIPLLWEYGQYQSCCLEVALLLLKKVTVDKRRSAIHVMRAILSQIAPLDNTGILSVAYNGRYGGGVHPCKWNGSVPILQKFYRTRAPTKFGQCWITAALGITLLRILGIPCRPVTCYDVAMTTKQPGRVNSYFSPEGYLVDNIKPNDSIWAYHVWIECWMRRDDLPMGYEGWQLGDCSINAGPATVIGPVPVKALRDELANNDTSSSNVWKSDINQLQSMINSEIRYHRVTHTHSTMSNQLCTLVQVQSNQTASKIVTSSIDQLLQWQDITAEYRNNYITQPQRQKTPSPCSSSHYPYPPPSRDCSMQVSLDQVTIGEDFNVTITLTNDGPMLRTFDGRVVGFSTQYTGQGKKSFVMLHFEGCVTPQQTAAVVLPIASRQYLRHLKEQNVLNFFVVAKTRETKQMFFVSQYHQLDHTPLSIKGPSTAQVGQLVRYTLSYRNTFSNSLSHITFVLQAQALCTHKEVAYRRILLPGRQAQVEITFPATHSGNYTLLASMHCDQLTNIHGWTELTVECK